MLKETIRFALFSLQEAFENIKNNHLLSLLTMGTVSVAMAFLGFFVLLFFNIENISSIIQRKSELIIYIKDGVSDKSIKTFRAKLKESKEFSGEKFLSKRDALLKFKEDFGIRQTVLDSLNKNPFPATLILELSKNLAHPDSIGKVATKYANHPLVEEVEYGGKWVERLDALLLFFRFSMFFIGSLLGLGLIFIVSNAIKLSIYFRRDEIEIMKLVGAPPRFIKGPFVIEGFVHGFTGSIISICFLYGGFYLFSRHIAEPVKALFLMNNILFIPQSVLLGMVFSGSAIGFLAANLSLHSLIRIRD